MERIGYILLSIIAIAWILGIIAGMVAAFPFGLIGLIVLVGIGLLFAKVVKDRMNNTEDDYYSKNVDK
jgi:F0F1-type ATP synthase assembly protein I